MEIARLIIILKDGTQLDLGQIEIRQRIRSSIQRELTDIIQNKIRITEPVLT